MPEKRNYQTKKKKKKKMSEWFFCEREKTKKKSFKKTRKKRNQKLSLIFFFLFCSIKKKREVCLKKKKTWKERKKKKRFFGNQFWGVSVDCHSNWKKKNMKTKKDQKKKKNYYCFKVCFVKKEEKIKINYERVVSVKGEFVFTRIRIIEVVGTVTSHSFMTSCWNKRLFAELKPPLKKKKLALKSLVGEL